MTNGSFYTNESEFVWERYELAMGRIRELQEAGGDTAYEAFGVETGTLILMLDDVLRKAKKGRLKDTSEAELRQWNEAFYSKIQGETYEVSYSNPAFACKKLGRTVGRCAASVIAELRAMVPYVFSGTMTPVLYAIELFLEVYQLLESKADAAAVKRALFYYTHDYCGEYLEDRMRQTKTTEFSYYLDIVKQEDLTSDRYLYLYGEYVSDTERKLRAFLASLPAEDIEAMADTFVGGYVRGFETMRMDLSKKTNVDLRVVVGFERITKRAIEKFEAMGKRCILYPVDNRMISRRAGRKTGVHATSANAQYEYDHRNDMLIVLNRRYLENHLNMLEEAYKRTADECRIFAGPACQEAFGEAEFTPVNKKEVLVADDRLTKILTEKAMRGSEIAERFLPMDEISFTIIAYPLPSIGDQFEEIFRETVKVNTLDNAEYKRIQQKLCDCLNQGVCVKIKGAGNNRTDLSVALYDLTNPEKEAIFENCTADVNIPVGEVFTSPKLTGTNGTLNVGSVYLEGNLYKNLTITFEDGMIADYSCTNFDSEEENRNYLRENVLMNHETLPMGEFAIGTNTTAYRMGRKFDIQAVLPILIAEKTGPHFAVGDTCYSHAEDHKVYNPDGKEIVARDNELVRNREMEPEKAYYNCHTDITIPYDELDSIIVVRKDGSQIPVILGGRFVVPGTEELNKAIEETLKF